MARNEMSSYRKIIQLKVKQFYSETKFCLRLQRKWYIESSTTSWLGFVCQLITDAEKFSQSGISIKDQLS